MLIDPRKVKKEDLPLIVMADDRRGLLGFLIKNHTKGNWNHIMCMHKEGYFASQNPGGYKEVPVESYMKNSIILKFWSYSKIIAIQKELWLSVIDRDLKDPKKSEGYDWLGLFGQAIGQPWINNPFIDYCSEMEAGHYREALQFSNIPRRPTPSRINKIFKTMSEMKIEGYWFND